MDDASYQLEEGLRAVRDGDPGSQKAIALRP
jgi:hypothetical protein